MNIRAAVLEAADRIEAEPDRFDFGSISIPGMTCGTPGCALGWVGAYMGLQATESLSAVSSLSAVCVALGADGGALTFYNRMDEMQCRFGPNDSHWSDNARVCAAMMRKYADQYHPAEKPKKNVGIPVSVRAIFETAQS